MDFMGMGKLSAKNQRNKTKNVCQRLQIKINHHSKAKTRANTIIAGKRLQ